ncbi:RING finger protein 222 [Corvus cornix cornix]|nr:PREDICTED: RING finger protein 222 [Corvus brachyrhynchos]XP_031985253.1 RING finger protein 222 [Corvus moneduloides]XP_039418527.1 RING finger protein 222 [Corvus cornix cornix]XP_048180129.1 RING finger protein 222 [Corvus hawaiiensis]NXD58578.1 RN222 protein [Corvus moneduloides]
MSETSSSKDGAPAECPVCYEKFQPLEATHRRLSCGHTFCHDCLVKCLLSAKLDGHIQSSIICPVCRYVTFLSKKKALWPPRAGTNPRALEMPLSPSSLSQLAKSEASNTLVVPSHFVMPVQSLERCSAGPQGLPGVLAREAHIFVISDHGMPLVAADCGSLGGRSRADTASSVSSSPALGLKCCQSPMALAVMLVLTVAMLAAVLPWLLLVKRDL